MIQPVTRDRNNEGEVIMIDIKDVLYIQTEDGAVVFQTESGKYYPLVPSLSMYAKAVGDKGFEKLDRINLVNMRKVKRFDPKRGMVFFDAVEDRPFTTVALMNVSKLKHKILEWIGRN